MGFSRKFGYEGKPVELSVINKKIPESEELSNRMKNT